MKYAVSGDAHLYNYLLAHSYRPNEHLEGLHKVPKLDTVTPCILAVQQGCFKVDRILKCWNSGPGSDSGTSASQNKQNLRPNASPRQRRIQATECKRDDTE